MHPARNKLALCAIVSCSEATSAQSQNQPRAYNDTYVSLLFFDDRKPVWIKLFYGIYEVFDCSDH